MLLKFLSLSLVLVAVGCVSPRNKEVVAPSAGADTYPQEEIIERKTAGFFFGSSGESKFENVLTQSVDGLGDSERAQQLMADAKTFMSERRKYGQIGAFLRKCGADENHPFCTAYRFKEATPPRGPRPPHKPKVAVKTVQKEIKSRNYEKLKQYNFQNILMAAKKMKTDSLQDFAKDVVAQEQCLSDDLYVALGSTLEIEFPDAKSVDLNFQLLEKSRQCSNTDFTARANFRLGMFRVWRNQCEEAIPMFDGTLANSSLRYLHSRSTYWREWCRNKKPTVEGMNTVEFYQTFPQSFHALLVDDGPTPMAYNLLGENSDPQVKFRTTTNKDFNDYLDTLDAFVRIGEPQITFSLLERLSADYVQNEDPQVLMYLAIICNRVQAGLIKFKILTRVFDRNPNMRTVNTMKLFYPSWYMDKVVQYKDRVNPYLIMALIRQESAFNTRAHSPAGARGLMQLMPATGRSFGRLNKNQLFTPDKNVAAGVRFIGYLMERYNNQVPLVLAAYNAGPLVVDEWVKRYPTDNPLLFIDIIPYRETREYVSSIMRNWYWYNKLYAESTPSQTSKNDPISKALASSP